MVCNGLQWSAMVCKGNGGMEWNDMAWHGMARNSTARHCTAQHCRQGMKSSLPSTVQYGTVRYGPVLAISMEMEYGEFLFSSVSSQLFSLLLTCLISFSIFSVPSILLFSCRLVFFFRSMSF